MLILKILGAITIFGVFMTLYAISATKYIQQRNDELSEEDDII